MIKVSSLLQAPHYFQYWAMLGFSHDGHHSSCPRALIFHVLENVCNLLFAPIALVQQNEYWHISEELGDRFLELLGGQDNWTEKTSRRRSTNFVIHHEIS